MPSKKYYTKRNKNKIEDDLQESKKRNIKTEKELRNSEENYWLLFDGMEEGFCIIEVLFDENEKPLDYRFLEVNPAFEKQTGLINAAGKRMREFAPEHEEYWFEIYGKVALTGQPARFQNHAKQLNRWYNVIAYRVGNPEKKHVAIIFSDISDQKRREAEAVERAAELEAILSRITEGLREKEILVKEIFHRTKNNMQVISSMLVLKTSALPDPKVHAIVADILDRIRAMALVHEKLIDRNDLSNVNLKDYIIELADFLLHDHVKDDKVLMKYDLEELNVLLDVALPCGLIITELIINSINYAFPGSRKGYIEIKLRRVEDNTIELIVADNGIGFIESDLDNADKMGLQLLKVIAETQLNALVDMKVDNGLIWTLKFKDVLYKERV